MPLATTDGPNPAAYMPYPVSTLSPRIVPTDLTTFKSRGVSGIQKDTSLRIQALHAEYVQVVDNFNWNKLIYESEFRFEPVIGETYHLYASTSGTGFQLSMIEPEKWPGRTFIATCRLGLEGRWEVQKVADGFDLKSYLETHPSS